MKTSIIFTVLILNTTLLFIEPLANLVQDINPWVFVLSEIALLIGYLTHKLTKDLKQTFDINIDDLRIFMFGNFK